MYTITLTNGNILTSVPDTQINSTYGGISLIGKNYDGFGTVLNNDLIHMLENFSSSTPPTNPLVGQIWYDSLSNTMNIWDGTTFNSICVITSNSIPPTNPAEGNQWFDNVNDQLYIWNGFTWVLIGPPGNQSGGKEGFILANVSINGSTVYFLDLYANNNLLGIVSSVNLVNPDLPGFSNIRPGLNFVTAPETTPPIVEGGIYNATELTLGNSDQFIISTVVEPLSSPLYENGLLEVNGNTSAVICASLYPNSPDANAAYQDLADNNIKGSVFTNQLVANSVVALHYEGLPPGLAIPGALGDVLTSNGADGFQVSPSFTFDATSNILSTNSLDLASNLVVSGTAIIGLNTTVGGSLTVDGDATIDQSLTVGLTSSFNRDVTMFGNLTVAGNEIVDGNITISENTIVNESLTVTENIAAGGNIAVGNSLTVVGKTTFNYGSAGVFTMPTTGGNNGNPLISTGAGAAVWGNSNISAYANNSLTTNGFQVLPSGLIMQWGQVLTDINNGFINVVFPVKFPTACFSVQATTYSPSDRITFIKSFSISPTGFTVGNNGDLGYATWFAVGA